MHWSQVAAEIVLAWRSRNGKGRNGKGHKTALAEQLSSLQQAASAAVGSQTDTFNLLATAEHRLLEALARGTMSPATMAAIIDKYTDALSRGVTTRQVDSIRTQLRFFRRAAETELPQARREEVTEQLAELERALPKTATA